MLSISRQRFGPIISALSLLLFSISDAGAERLPLRAYTTADGLPNNTINKIVPDSRGFLWFCTDEGLSRFDGYEFTNYGTNHGLPHPVVNDFLETREGEYWVATTGGLSKFNPRGEPANRVIYADSPRGEDPREPMFTVYKLRAEDRYTRAITTLLERRDGTLWYGTNNGLFRIARENGRINLLPVEVGMSPGSTGQRIISTVVEDGHGTLWIGGPHGLHRLWPDGTFASYGRNTGLPDTFIHDLLDDHKGNLWVATRHGGLAQLAVTASGPPVSKHIYNDKNGLPSNWIFDLFQSANGKLWVGTNLGLCEFLLDDSGNGNLLRIYTRRNGFSYHEIVNLAEDREGNLWLGLENGAMKLARNGFTTFEERDGVCCVRSFFRSEAGEFFAYAYLVPNPGTSRVAAKKDSQIYSLRLGRFDGQQFTWLLPDALMTKYPGWSTELIALQARTGEWWIGTGEGLYQFPPVKNFAALKRARPAAIYSARDGMATAHVYCLFEDSRGDLWISSIGPENGLARWERTTRKVQNMSNTPGLPSLKEKLATVFQEDSGGNLWVGFNDGFLGRYREGRFKIFTPEDGLPGRVEDLFNDHRGNLWAAMGRGGLSRVDNPTAEHPTFVNYTTAEGLATNYVTAVTEDLYGRIYIATGQGIDRLEPATGRIRHYTTADGLALGRVLSATRDGQGAIWVGTLSGMSWLHPEPVEPTIPPPILIKGVRVAGTPHNVSAIGETEIYLPELQANENQLEIDFVGLSFAPGESLRYQYRLEGANDEWSAATGQRTINFANLAPGRYRFLVRGLNSDDVTSPQPATISFTILPPMWQRWWFLTLLAMTIGLVAYTLYRYRLRRLVELERVRTRIAGDLHDDIGAGLSRIAILSELGRQETGRGPGSERLSAIARASRELVDSMSDIVWAINPERDQLRDLIQRMRRFASDIFTARGINFSFRAPTEERNLKVGADVRRHIYLVFKESVNNVVRHSGCTEAQIDLMVEANSFVMVIKDNGGGFAPAQVGDGNGLVNMRERARLMGAQFWIDSADGQGTTVTLRVPFRATVKEPDGRLGRRKE